MNEDRLRRQVAELSRSRDELKDEIRRLERRHIEAFERQRGTQADARAMGGATNPKATSGAAPLSEKENRGDLVLLRKHLRQNGAC